MLYCKLRFRDSELPMIERDTVSLCFWPKDYSPGVMSQITGANIGDLVCVFHNGVRFTYQILEHHDSYFQISGKGVYLYDEESGSVCIKAQRVFNICVDGSAAERFCVSRDSFTDVDSVKLRMLKDLMTKGCYCDLKKDNRTYNQVCSTLQRKLVVEEPVKKLYRVM